MIITLSTVLLLTLSIIIGSLTLFLVIINWKLWRVSIGILNVSIELLRETVTIKDETIYIREVSLQILDESVLLRKALTLDVGELKPKSKSKTKKIWKGD